MVTKRGGASEVLTDHTAATEQCPCSVIVELGSGMGTAGLAAAEALYKSQATSMSALRLTSGVVVTHTNASDDPAAVHEKPPGRPTKSANVVLTDLPDVCTLLRENVSMQLDHWKRAGLKGITAVDKDTAGFGRGELFELRVRKLAWGNEGHVRCLSKELQGLYPSPVREGDVNLTILCSDLVYFPHLLAPLLRTLIHITSPSFLPNASAQAKIIISYRVRSFAKETTFWRAFGAWFTFRPVLERIPDDEWRRLGWDESALSFVFIAHRRPETYSWHCPEEDYELLHGFVGDDTFEILLMLCNDALED